MRPRIEHASRLDRIFPSHASRMKTHKFFNTATRQAMFEKVKGYVDKSLDLNAEIARIQREHGLERVYRFDLGENAEG